MKIKCDKCGKLVGEHFRTSYGEKRCETCYDDHLMTDKGKVEYFIGIVEGELPIEDYDADFLGHVSACWQKYRWDLILSARDLRDIEDNAKLMGLL